METGLTTPPIETNARLLIVDDERHIRSALARAMSLVGYAVDEAASGEEALRILAKHKYNLMILDIMMPGVDGVEVMHRVHRHWPDLLMIVLTGHASLESAITAIRTEAIDYLIKPATTQEIVEAVERALRKDATRRQQAQLVEMMGQALSTLRRSQATDDDVGVLEVGGDPLVTVRSIQLDCQRRIVTFVDRPDQLIDLTKGETAILANLMNHANQVLSCQHLMRAVWGYSTDRNEAENVIRPYISRLRRKLEANSKQPKFIRTVRRQGYCFVNDPAE
jgi:DNA-binding response OmpR family regulator